MDLKDIHSSTFRPVNGKIFAKVDPLLKQSAGGIALVSQRSNPVDKATIVAISNEGYDQKTGKSYTNDDFNVGDRIVFNYGVREYMEFADGMHVLLDRTSIYAVLAPDSDNE